MGLEIDGLDDVFDELDQLQEDYTGGGRWVVGTAVNYSVFLEFGTSRMDARPFFRPALLEVRQAGVPDFIERNTRTTVDAIDSADELVAILARSIERRVKEIITKRGLVDTGALRASVLAVKSASSLPDESDFSGFDSENPAPVGAGKALASEDIEIE